MAERDVTGVLIGGGTRRGAAAAVAKPKMRCCRSRPRCNECPVRRVAQAPGHQRIVGRAALFEDILRGSAPAVPASVTDALLALSAARGEHLATRRAR